MYAIRSYYALHVLGVFHQHRAEGLEHLAHGLVEFHLARVAIEDLLVNRFDFFVELSGSYNFV